MQVKARPPAASGPGGADEPALFGYRLSHDQAGKKERTMSGGDFFRPLWRRVIVVAIAGGWAVVELSAGEPIWAAIAAAVAAWGVWSLLLRYEEPGKGEPGD